MHTIDLTITPTEPDGKPIQDCPPLKAIMIIAVEQAPTVDIATAVVIRRASLSSRLHLANGSIELSPADLSLVEQCLHGAYRGQALIHMIQALRKDILPDG